MYYRCSKRFVLDQIVDMFSVEIRYGIVLIAGNGYMFYDLVKTGTHVEINLLKDKSVKLQNKHKKGGSSAGRYGRIRDGNELQYIKKVSERMIDTFMTNRIRLNVKALIIAGPAEKKRKVVELSETQQLLGKHIIKIVDTAEIGENVVWEVYEKCLNELAVDEEKDALKLINQIKDTMLEFPEQLAFGLSEITDGLKLCTLEKILISSDLCQDTKNTIYELNTYNCLIIESNPNNFKSIGIDMIGIKWY